MRRIHWTATARTGRLVVKQYQSAISRDTLICLDLDPRDYQLRQRHEATELAIIVAASLASHMIGQERLPVGLVTSGRIGGEAGATVPEQESGAPTPADIAGSRRHISIPPGTRRTHLMRLLEALARVEAIEGGNFVELLRRESANVRWGSTIVVITGRVGDTLADALLYLKRSGHAVALILVRPDMHQGAPPGIPVHRVWTTRDLARVS